MSTSMTERWVDRVDPYGYGRQSGLKVSYVAIIFFLINAFWMAPTFAVLTMCVAGAGIALIEMPSVNTPQKKDISYIAFTAMTIVTVSIFGFFRYFTWLEVVAVIGWAYVLYRFAASDTEKAQVVAIALLIGFVSFEGLGASDFDEWLNQTAFYVQFAVVAFVAHKLFPNRYDRIIKAAMRQIWLLQHRQLNRPEIQTRTDVAAAFLKHLSVITQVQALVPARMREQLPGLIDALWSYQIWLQGYVQSAATESIEQARMNHERWFEVMCSPQTTEVPLAADDLPAALVRLCDAWRDLCR